MQQYRPFALLGALVAVVYLAGWFDLIERPLSDWRAGLAGRAASEDLVIVTLSAWPGATDELFGQRRQLMINAIEAGY